MRNLKTFKVLLILFLLLCIFANSVMAEICFCGEACSHDFRDNVEKNAFETYQLPPDYTYYYSGPDAYPNAVIGIRNAYHLESKFWKPVALTQTLLKRWLENKGHTRVGYNHDKNGSDIIAPDGRQVGIWYAVRNWKDLATVKMIDDKTVNVSSPLKTVGGRKT